MLFPYSPPPPHPPNINEYLKKILKNLNHTNSQLKNALEIIDDLILGPYQKIGHFGYFYKWNQLMDYQRGQKACSKLHGHIIEFDERNEGRDVTAICNNIKERGDQSFY